ncbi:MAG: hypothetical protein M3413_09670 [Bacteroidota bacterium]|jgi:predicted membrane protein|nr:hypothetical protein [Flavisolibacter sp.]MDQ3551784.1 hypothetical protein [Bacteroidota bacterium]
MENAIKKFLGLVWIVLAPLAIFYLIKTAMNEIVKNPVADTIIQWSVFVFVFIPIAIGFVIFGYYAWKGEYNKLPESDL